MPRRRNGLSDSIEEGSRLVLFRRFFAVLFHSRFRARRIPIGRRDARPARADVSILTLEAFTRGSRMFDEIVTRARSSSGSNGGGDRQEKLRQVV
jgi:hypothetical protein